MSDAYDEERKTFHLFGTFRDIPGDDRDNASNFLASLRCIETDNDI
jgi:hypothetical protein